MNPNPSKRFRNCNGTFQDRLEIMALQNSTRPLSVDERWAILWRDKETCQECGATESRLYIHHLKERHLGGTNHPNNLISLCHYCHKSKHKNGYRPKDKRLNA